MDELINLARQETLETLYLSVDRMNEHVARNEPEGVAAEQHLQKNLGRILEDLRNSEDLDEPC